MQLKIKNVLKAWGPAILWMSLIFLGSSRTRIGIHDKHIVNFIVFKSLHIIEYAVLYLLLIRGFVMGKWKNKRNYLISAVVIALIYAVGDEIHQTFVPTRDGKLQDVFIDGIGIYLSYIYTKHNFKKIEKILVQFFR